MGLGLRVATLNTWALPWPVGRAVERRMRAIAAALPALELDVLALQEVWRRDARQALVAAGASAGLSEVWFDAASASGGGLLVLSRLPIRAARFEPFAVRGLPHRVWHGDYYAGKGFALLDVETAAGAVSFLDTHLHAQYAPDAFPEYYTYRSAQVVQLAAALRDVRLPIVAAGDFNLIEGSEEYRLLAGLSGLRDVAAALETREPTSFAANPYSPPRDGPDARIDYVWVRDGVEQGLRPLSVRRVFDEPLSFDGEPAACSDHAGVLAELESGAPDAPRPVPSGEVLARAVAVLARGRDRARTRRSADRLAAGALLGGGALAVAGRRAPPLTRRGLLRGALLGAAGLGTPLGVAFGLLAEWHGPSQQDGFAEVGRALARLRS